MESFWKSTANRNRHGSSEAEPAVPAWHSRGPASVYITFQRKHNSGWTPRYKDWEPRACLSGARMELDSARQELPDQALCSFYCPDPCWAPPRSLAACRRLYPAAWKPTPHPGLAVGLGQCVGTGRLGEVGTAHTLSVFVYPLKKRKLLRVVHNHEFLEQPLDDLTDGGGAADVQLLDGIKWQVEGRPLICGGCGVHLLNGVVDRLGSDPSGYRHGSSEFQMHFDEARVGAVFTLHVGSISPMI